MLPNWDASIWFGAGGLLIGVVGSGLAFAAWRWPRQAPAAPPAEPEPHEVVRVEVTNYWPVFTQPDGSQRVGEHFVAVTLRNGSERPVKAVSWGLRLPGRETLFASTQATPWVPPMPCWVQPGDEATWLGEAAELRRAAKEHGIDFKDMTAYVSLADGREIKAEPGVPLSAEQDVTPIDSDPT